MSLPNGNISEANVNSSSDLVANARTDLLDLVTQYNAIINMVNQNSGVPKLSGTAKVESTQLVGAVNADSVNNAIVETRHFPTANSSTLGITNAKVLNGTITTSKIYNATTSGTNGYSTSTTLNSSSESTIVPTQQAVKSFIFDNANAGTFDYAIYTKSRYTGGSNTFSNISTSDSSKFVRTDGKAQVKQNGLYYIALYGDIRWDRYNYMYDDDPENTLYLYHNTTANELVRDYSYNPRFDNLIRNMPQYIYATTNQTFFCGFDGETDTGVEGPHTANLRFEIRLLKEVTL
tara:strand:- start:1324 stop:2196 length:873 start_codon:yes stop_codon:yes gene_type:complete